MDHGLIYAGEGGWSGRPDRVYMVGAVDTLG